MASNYRNHYIGGEEESRIEIIPMIDVMMFLLVFFVLIMLEMIQNAGIEINIPQSSTAQKIESVELNIGINNEGFYFVEGKQVDPTAITEMIIEAKTDEKKTVSVVISGEKTTSYQNVVEVMDIARSAGVSAISLATEE